MNAVSGWTLSDSVLIAILTAGAYAVAFAYEAGFASYFSIPVELIATSVNTLLVAFGYIAVTLSFYYFTADFVWIWAPRSNSMTAKTVRRFMAFALIVGVVLSPLLDQLKGWLMLALVLALVAFFDFLFPLLTQRHKTTYEEKLLAQEEIEVKAREHTLLGALRKQVGANLLRLIFLVVLAIICAYNVGTRQARNKVDFYITKSTPAFAVLKIYGDVVVAAPFDRSKKTISGALRLHKLNDAKGLLIQLQAVGPLQQSPE